MTPVFVSTVGAPHASNAVAVPSAAVIATGSGSQPRSTDPELIVNAGGVLSANQLTVLDTLAVLPHASNALNVLVSARLHPLLTIGPSTAITVGPLQASDAIAAPSVAFIVTAEGLQPRSTVP